MNYIPVPEENIDGPLGIKYPRKEKMARVFSKNYNYKIVDEEEDDEI